MQNRFVGDIGDYVKLAMLRALSPGFILGIAWWLYEDESHNNDGRHLDYLSDPKKWRHYDPELFDGLKKIVESGRRDVKLLEQAKFLPGAAFYSDLVPVLGTPATRRQERLEWYQRLKEEFLKKDLVFLDPDNGLETDGFSMGTKAAGKSVSVEELVGLARTGCCLIVYHHQTRRKGGHLEEIQYWSARLKSKFQSVDAIRSKSFSPRVFFILNATDEIQARARRLTQMWGDRLTWHPHL